MGRFPPSWFIIHKFKISQYVRALFVIEINFLWRCIFNLNLKRNVFLLRFFYSIFVQYFYVWKKKNTIEFILSSMEFQEIFVIFEYMMATIVYYCDLHAWHYYGRHLIKHTCTNTDTHNCVRVWYGIGNYTPQIKQIR